MTLDESYISQREAMRRQEDEDRARVEAEWRLREELESLDAEAARWSSLMQRAAAERPVCWYDERPAIDRRLHDWRAAIADGLEPDVQADGVG